MYMNLDWLNSEVEGALNDVFPRIEDMFSDGFDKVLQNEDADREDELIGEICRKIRDSLKDQIKNRVHHHIRQRLILEIENMIGRIRGRLIRLMDHEREVVG